MSDLQDGTGVVKRLRRDCSVFDNMREKATVRGRASTMVKHAKWIWLKRYLWFVVRIPDKKLCYGEASYYYEVEIRTRTTQCGQ